MKTTTSTISAKTIINYAIIALSACGLGYSLANYFIFNKEVSIWLVLICVILFAKSMGTAAKAKYSK
ncbi:MAG: hypothetical protein V4670_06885 [Bacteroidota bacterium]